MRKRNWCQGSQDCLGFCKCGWDNKRWDIHLHNVVSWRLWATKLEIEGTRMPFISSPVTPIAHIILTKSVAQDHGRLTRFVNRVPFCLCQHLLTLLWTHKTLKEKNFKVNLDWFLLEMSYGILNIAELFSHVNHLVSYLVENCRQESTVNKPMRKINVDRVLWKMAQRRQPYCGLKLILDCKLLLSNAYNHYSSILTRLSDRHHCSIYRWCFFYRYI